MVYIRVVSQYEIKRYECDKKHVVISIRDSWEPSFPLPNNQNRLDSLRLQFDDIKGNEKFTQFVVVSSDKTIESNSLVLFDINMADQIKNFVLKYQDVEEIIVNCYMGISRSSGVARALMDWKPDVYEFCQRFNHNPNTLVHDTLLDLLQKSE